MGQFIITISKLYCTLDGWMGGYHSTQVAFVCYERVTDKNECVSRKAIVGLTTHHKYNYWLTIL